MSALNSTPNKQLLKSKRVSVSMRLLDDDHTELKNAANEQQRSMSFVAMRRYLNGRSQELLNLDTYKDNINLNKGIKNVR